jgi:very-short-patch-repair endonuclease
LWIFTLRFVIEVDGDSHFSEEGKAYDAERSTILEGYGLRLSGLKINRFWKNWRTFVAQSANFSILNAFKVPFLKGESEQRIAAR